MFIARYHEIALKGGNRSFFESRLKKHLQRGLEGVEGVRVSRMRDHFRIECPDEAVSHVRHQLKHTFGVVNFSYVEKVGAHLDEIVQKGVGRVSQFMKLEGLSGDEVVTFSVRVTRRDKSLPKSSMELSRDVAAMILPQFSNLKVKLKNPQITLYVDWDQEEALIYVNKEAGPGGLPIGSAGKVVSLLSAGFDSPVASWKMMRRGATVIFVHFHSYPSTGPESMENVEEIIKILNKYQLRSKLYLIPLVDYQKEVVSKCPGPLRVLLYRRMMIRLANRVMSWEKGKALITGESLGQVASQTLDNLHVVDVLAQRPMLRPLIGTDKEEIVDLSRKIGTFDICAEPYEDCCSLFIPKAPALAAQLNELEEAESSLDVATFEESLWKAREMKRIGWSLD